MELLAPAGSFENLKAAVNSGADAVYIGGSMFSARRSAVNFTSEEVEKAVRYCKVRGVALHVAANILIKEKEKKQFFDYIGFLNDVGVDAVIVQDIGMAAAIRKMYPDLPIHASTQMTAASLDAVKRLEDIGFSRVVLARELSRDAIENICGNTNIETEVFVHGALCMCYSGQCLMSSMIGGRSGNRGMCAQPCRLPYEIDGKQGYLLSPKDLALINKLGELEKMGVDSLKIEGRLKSKEYTAAVTGIYRKYTDSKKQCSESDYGALCDIFSRGGFTTGYYDGKIGADMMSYNMPGNSSSGVFSQKVKECCEEKADLKKRKIYISAGAHFGEPLNLIMWDEEGHCVNVQGTNLAEKAEKAPLTEERLSKQLLKLGTTPFWADSVETHIDDDISVPISEINSVRREAAEKLETEIAAVPSRRKFFREQEMPESFNGKTIITAQVATYEQAMVCKKAGIEEIYAPTKLADKLAEGGSECEFVAVMPPVKREDRKYQTPNADTILVSNIGQIDEEKSCIGDFRMNVTNSDSVLLYGKYMKRVTLSPELNLKEMMPISEGCEVIAYGRVPLMVMENCPVKAAGKCVGFGKIHYLKDRKNEKFPILCREGCTSEILNSKPIYMADKADDLKKLKAAAIRLIFTVENAAECGKIIEEYKRAISGEYVAPPKENTFTRGHFYRGVE